MGVTVSDFGATYLGNDFKLYTIKNSKGTELSVTNIGAILVKLVVSNDKGEFKDVVMGFNSGENYLINGSFFGATVGPVANRTANAQFSVDGQVYNLIVNDNANNLHTDFDKGFHKVLWDAKTGDNFVEFSRFSPDLEYGLPGNLNMKVTYTLTDDNEVKITYDGMSDKKTLINMTNHSYFNLAGHKAGAEAVYNTKLWLKASNYTPVVPGAIPTGEIKAVAGTAFDFTKEKSIGRDINATDEQLLLVKGYDHNFAIDDYNGKSQLIAKVSCDGREMEVYTDLPGVQFYAGNCIGACEGKEGSVYGPRMGFCLETQYFPNSANEKNFVNPIFDANEKYHTETIYKFK